MTHPSCLCICLQSFRTSMDMHDVKRACRSCRQQSCVSSTPPHACECMQSVQRASTYFRCAEERLQQRKQQVQGPTSAAAAAIASTDSANGTMRAASPAASQDDTRGSQPLSRPMSRQLSAQVRKHCTRAHSCQYFRIYRLARCAAASSLLDAKVRSMLASRQLSSLQLLLSLSLACSCFPKQCFIVMNLM